jgi:hypothetical protein
MIQPYGSNETGVVAGSTQAAAWKILGVDHLVQQLRSLGRAAGTDVWRDADHCGHIQNEMDHTILAGSLAWVLEHSYKDRLPNQNCAVFFCWEAVSPVNQCYELVVNANLVSLRMRSLIPWSHNIFDS